MTKRADLKEKRDAVDRFGLDESAFLVSNYVKTRTMGDLSDEQMEEAIEMAGLGAFEVAIARCLGVDANVFTTALSKGHKNPDSKYGLFAKRFFEARKQHMKRNLRRMNEAVDEGDWKPAAWQLERSFGFHKQEHVEHDVGPQTLSLMALAQIPLADAEAALEIEAESVVVEGED